MSHAEQDANAASAAGGLRRYEHIAPNTPEKPVLVVVLDGWGADIDNEYNALTKADTPFMDRVKADTPDRYILAGAHGRYVGLNEDDMGNSEVGHNALGGGKIVDQGSVLVDKAIESGEVFEHDTWRDIEADAVENTLHLIGLLSDGGVHSKLTQLISLLQGAAERGVRRIRLHLLTDGRDCTDGSSIALLKTVLDEAKTLEGSYTGLDIKVASGGGRMKVTMDRYESDWRVVQRGYYAHVLGEAPHTFTDPIEAIKTLKKPSEAGDKPVSDQQIPPFVIVDESSEPVGTVQDGDVVVVFNFRADRVVEISKALEYEKFEHFDRKRFPKIKFAGIIQYDGELKLPKKFLVPPPKIEHPTCEFLVKEGVSIFATAESQKIGHVTFFWNGNRSGKFDENLETYQEIKSDQDIGFDEKPKMQAAKIAKVAEEALRSKKYRYVRVNFANPDMVAHTGNFDATVEACSEVDKCVKLLVDTVEELGGIWLVTSDHGNCESMVQRHTSKHITCVTGVTRARLSDEDVIYEDGKPVPLTSHTTNKVPVAIGGPALPSDLTIFNEDIDVGIANVGSTVFNLLGYEVPEGYGFEPSLLRKDRLAEDVIV